MVSTTFNFSRLLSGAYPAIVAASATVIAWTSAKQGNDAYATFYIPNLSYSRPLSFAASKATCSEQDHFRLTNADSCPEGERQLEDEVPNLLGQPS